ncbi:hypothetical protein AAHH78_36805, partial [Burkholderia pseudomallei]
PDDLIEERQLARPHPTKRKSLHQTSDYALPDRERSENNAPSATRKTLIHDHINNIEQNR